MEDIIKYVRVNDCSEVRSGTLIFPKLSPRRVVTVAAGVGTCITMELQYPITACYFDTRHEASLSLRTGTESRSLETARRARRNAHCDWLAGRLCCLGTVVHCESARVCFAFAGLWVNQLYLLFLSSTGGRGMFGFAAEEEARLRLSPEPRVFLHSLQFTLHHNDPWPRFIVAFSCRITGTRVINHIIYSPICYSTDRARTYERP